MAAVCLKIQNSAQNDNFLPNDNMTLYTTGFSYLSVYEHVFGDKEYIKIVFEIQNGCQVQTNSKWSSKCPPNP